MSDDDKNSDVWTEPGSDEIPDPRRVEAINRFNLLGLVNTLKKVNIYPDILSVLLSEHIPVMSAISLAFDIAKAHGIPYNRAIFELEDEQQ